MKNTNFFENLEKEIHKIKKGKKEQIKKKNEISDENHKVF